MRLPYSIEFGYINYVLSSLIRLTEKESPFSVDVLIDLLQMQVFNGELYIKYHEILNICNNAGFISLQKGKVIITSLGKEFYRLNPDEDFEFTKEQKMFFATELLFLGPWKSRIKRIFLPFEVDTFKHTFILRQSDDCQLNPTLLADIRSLSYLQVISSIKDRFTLQSEYVKFIVQFRNEKVGLSQDELDKRLQRQRDQGAMAEEIILRYEKLRLCSLGREIEGDRVVLVSQLEVDAGYDIRSFDGDGPTVEYDRFIEVKSSENTNLSFYWSNNEISVARKLGNKYWIYFVGGFSKGQDVENVDPVLIQNPYEKIFSVDYIECVPNTYRVFLKNKIEYQQLGYFKGQLL